MLGKEDESALKPLLESNNIDMNSCGIVKLYTKIIIQDSVVIYSKESKRITKRNSYTVTFVDPERPSHIRYGRVLKFLRYPPDSPDGICAAIIEELKIDRCRELESLSFPPEIQCISHLLCADFVSVVGELPKVAIAIDHIVAKCFDISSVSFSIISSLVCHSEVLK